MENKKYLIVVDTVGNREANTVLGVNGMLDVQIISTTSEDIAIELFLKSQPPRHAAALRNSLYVYDLETVLGEIDAVDAAGGNGWFRFVQAGGRRPPKPVPLAQRVQVSASGETVTTAQDSQDMDNRSAQQPPSPLPREREELVENVNKSPRNHEFRKQEETMGTTSDKLTAEQAALVNSVGAGQTTQGMDENVNLRVNSAVGSNNVQAKPQQVETSNDVSSEGASILQSLGVDVPNDTIVNDPELNSEIAEMRGGTFEDPSLGEIPTSDGILDDAAIAALESEYKEAQGE